MFKNLATVLRIDPPRTVQVWYKGKLRSDLISFDEAGHKLLRGIFRDHSPSDDPTPQVKDWLNRMFGEYDFEQRGPVHLDEPLVKRLLGIPQ